MLKKINDSLELHRHNQRTVQFALSGVFTLKKLECSKQAAQSLPVEGKNPHVKPSAHRVF